MKNLKMAIDLMTKYTKTYDEKEHVLYVMHLGKNEDEMIVGVLHDLMEDYGFNVLMMQEFKECKFSDEINEALVLLTHNRGVSYEDYIDIIVNGGNKLAKQVKLNDLQHNMIIDRLDRYKFNNRTRYEKLLNKVLTKYKEAKNAIENSL